MDRRPLIVGNWKMNGLKLEAVGLAEAIVDGAKGMNCDIVICPSTIFLHAIHDVTDQSDVALGGQDCHLFERGAHTGDIAASMLADAGCEYVILGHSERRIQHGETDKVIHDKANAAFAAGLKVIICVGETAEERNAGATIATISTQLDASIPVSANAENCVIAYEPVWAIGTGNTASPEDAQDVHDHIRTYVQTSHGIDMAEGVRILYGGSMKADNAEALLAQPDIDGGLVGGAALDSDAFLTIAEASGL